MKLTPAVFQAFLFILPFVVCDNKVNITAEFEPRSVDLELGKSQDVNLVFSEPLGADARVRFTYQFGDDISTQEDVFIIDPLPDLILAAGTNHTSLRINASKAGSVILGIQSNDSQFSSLIDAYSKITVVHSHSLAVFVTIIGWLYFVAWSVSFYPQVISNFRRKSVIGLNFDFLAMNLTGFLAYGVFNVGMFWIEDIKHEYGLKHPRGVNPVLLNDVVFTLHAVLVTAFTIFQACIYERGSQRVSRITTGILVVCWAFAGVSLIVVLCHKITWLTYVYYFSYIKLGITLIKYIPQAYMNFRRKSTEGWSIGNVMLDFTGGSLSLLQMFLLSYNNDDWDSIFGDPTKFGLGFFSVLFDILFMVQHYCLYRSRGGYLDLVEDDLVVNVDAANPVPAVPLPPQNQFYDGS